jgi:folate-binding protein YgfZ
MQPVTSPQELVQASRTLETTAAYRTWPELSAVRVRGEDRVSWLNGQVTNDVRQIPPGGCVHALSINIRGKIQAELWVADLGESLLLLLPQSSEAALLESLEHYIIMEDVVLERVPEWQVLGLEGPRAPAIADSLEASVRQAAIELKHGPLGVGGVLWVGTQASLEALVAQLSKSAPQVDPRAYELVRLRHSVPRYGVDYDEHHYPQEAGLKALVSFQKGCYLGQEVVCTLESRGKLSRRLCVLLGTQADVIPAPGTALHLPDAAENAEPAGHVTSAIWDPEQSRSYVLAYVRRTHTHVGSSLVAAGQTLTLASIVGEDASAPATS